MNQIKQQEVIKDTIETIWGNLHMNSVEDNRIVSTKFTQCNNYILFMEENVLVPRQYMLKYISVFLNAKNPTCPRSGLLLGSEIDAIPSEIIKALMFIFLKVSVFYDVK